MKPLIVLAGVFLITIAVLKIATGNYNIGFSGNLAMFLMLCFTAMGHFVFAKGMIMMMPAFVPFKREVVFLTGLAEPLLGLALLFPAARFVGGVALVSMFVLMLPANIFAAVKHVDYEKATYGGRGPAYLWFRIPLQVIFIAWVLFFSIRR